MLHDEDFSRNAPVDRYGRKLARDDTKKQLAKFYDFEDEDDNDSIDDDDEVQRELKRVNDRSYDPARGGGFSESSSSEDESSSSDEDSEDEDDSEAAGSGAEELDFPDKQQIDVPLGEVTNRVAVVNLDWDNIRAEDLMAVFSSFLPTGGRVLKVSVFPSEFGRERMEREEVEGPPREIFTQKRKDNEDDENDDEEADSEEEAEQIKKSMLKEDTGQDFNSTQLRRYQIERLRYFYAILTFSSKEAAKHVYDSVDGAEYLSSANFFDLRFVPDDIDFTDDKPRDECERIPDGYKPNDFVTDALQHSNVKLTWDADDKTRQEAQARVFSGSRKDIDENDLKAYLASDSSEDEDEDEQVEVVDSTGKGGSSSSKASKKEAEKQRMRSLLGLSTEPESSSKPSKSDAPVGEMEVTFTSGLAGEPNRETVFENEPEPEESTIDKYVRRERERKKRRKEKMKAVKRGEEPAEADDEADKHGGESATAGKKATEQQQQSQEEDEDLGFNDPFFEDPDSKGGTAKNRRKEEKRKKREERAAEEAASAAQRAELELLMTDEKKPDMKHFDMNEIEKAEKQARKKKKGSKAARSKSDEKTEPADDFQMDVGDPRFARLFESHEFAIDPTNPRFKATSGMTALLEEGRKRRRNREGMDEDDDRMEDRGGKRSKKQKKGSSDAKETTGEPDDLKKLVEKVKRKAQKA